MIVTGVSLKEKNEESKKVQLEGREKEGEVTRPRRIKKSIRLGARTIEEWPMRTRCSVAVGRCK